jgi:nicotinate-nucleotide pyrophosphorylase (carboxylating)
MLSPAVEQLIDLALQEDLAYGDLTTESLFSKEHTSTAVIAVRHPAIVSGIELAQKIFNRIDPALRCEACVEDGAAVIAGVPLLKVAGSTISMLKAERLVLNFLQHLSGIATLTYQYVGAISGTTTRITHTRKTTPGLRALEIEAVKHGGGESHRFSLSHAVLLKDNHIQAAGGITQAVEKIRQHVGHTVKIEVECDTLQQVEEALKAGIDLLLIDNMDLPTTEKAVHLAKGKALIEASGGIRLNTVLGVARLGVDIISTSQITMNAMPVDIGLDFQPETVCC